MKLFLFLLFFISIAHAQSPWYFGSGEAVNLTNGTAFKNGVKNITGALDPSTTAVNAPSGSMYFSTSGTIYVKQDAGLSTNWLPLGIATMGSLTTLNGQSGPNVNIATGSSGTDFNIGAAANVITLNLPTASASNRGLLSTSDWSLFNSKEPAITATTSADYYRGDKTFATLNKAAVGLGNVDNTSDLNKPISTATQTALNLKADDSTVVHLTGAQAVAGAKNFTSDVTALDLKFNDPAFSTISTKQALSHQMGTGVISGAILSIGSPNTTFSITQQELLFSDYSVSTLNPTVKVITCPALTNQTVPNIGTQSNTYVSVDATCAFVFSSTFPTQIQRRTNAFVGRLVHPAAFVATAATLPDFSIDTNSQLYDLFDAIGAFNVSGNIISPNGANLSINKSAGVSFRRSIGYATNKQNPNTAAIAAQTPSTIVRFTQTTQVPSSFTVVDPANYDVAGTVTLVSAAPAPTGLSASTNQRVYLFGNGQIGIQYGQVKYTNLANAIAGISTESFVVNPTAADGGILRAIVSCRRDATDVSDPSQCVITTVGRFDNSGIGTGSLATTTLQQAYNNSTTPQITTSTTGGSVDIKRGSAADTDKVVRVQNGAGTETASINGNGEVLGSNLAINKNILTNPSFEHLGSFSTGWTSSAGTFTQESTVVIDGIASAKLVLSSQTASLTQSSTLYQAQFADGVQGLASVRIKSSVALSVCSIQAGTVSTTNCVTTSADSKWGLYKIPFILGATSNGISIASSGAVSGTVYIDDAFVGAVDLKQDVQSVTTQTTKFSAGSTGTGVTLTGTPATVGAGNFTISSGVMTALRDISVTISCTTSNSTSVTTQPTIYVNGASTGQLSNTAATTGFNSHASWEGIVPSGQTFYCVNGSSTATLGQVTVLSTNVVNTSVYTSTNADTDWAACGHTTSDFTGFGTVTNIETQCKRDGDDLLMRGKFTSGTSTATEARVALKLNGISLTSAGISSIPSIQYAGATTTSLADTIRRYHALIEPSVGYFTFGNPTAGVAYSSGFAKKDANAVASSTNVTGFTVRVPIAGWNNSNIIIGSFKEVPTTRGSDGADFQSVYFGGNSTCSAACTTGSCTICNQVGNKITSVTWAATGEYRVNGIDGTKYNCTGSGTGTNYTTAQHSRNTSTSTYASIAFGSAGTAYNSGWANVICIGIP